MDEKIAELQSLFQKELDLAQSSSDLEELRLRYFGKKGAIQALMQELKSVDPAQRPKVGQKINLAKQSFLSEIDQKKNFFIASEVASQMEAEKLDVTLPGKKPPKGQAHPITAFMDKLIDIFNSMGFSVALGPQIEEEHYNFTGLNFAQDHPARDMQDTFWLSDSFLLRTHTSNVQLRALKNHSPPIRMIAPGKVYRNEDVSVRSHVLFHQIEGFYVDKGVSLADLLSTLKLFFKKLFGDVEVRFRPSYFPFVEPGLEADVTCLICKGSGCRICKDTGWLEVLGAGMIHPEVLKNGGIDPEEYSGYAWGLGVERLLMILSKVSDIRLFLENDVRFLRQF